MDDGQATALNASKRVERRADNQIKISINRLLTIYLAGCLAPSRLGMNEDTDV